MWYSEYSFIEACIIYLSGIDKARFSIHNLTGVVTTTDTLDREEKSLYTFTVQVFRFRISFEIYKDKFETTSSKFI